jgi:hypothetical protein
MRRLSFICIAWFDASSLMKPCGSVRVVRMWCGICTDPILKCFDNSEGLSYGNLVVGVISRALKLANSMRLGIVVPSQDLSGACINVLV